MTCQEIGKIDDAKWKMIKLDYQDINNVVSNYIRENSEIILTSNYLLTDSEVHVDCCGHGINKDRLKLISDNFMLHLIDFC